MAGFGPVIDSEPLFFDALLRRPDPDRSRPLERRVVPPGSITAWLKLADVLRRNQRPHLKLAASPEHRSVPCLPYTALLPQRLGKLARPLSPRRLTRTLTPARVSRFVVLENLQKSFF